MISVEFRAVKSGRCGWCRKDRDEVYDVAFSDKSFVGLMCKADLLRAIGMKVEMQPTPAAPKPEPRPATIPPAAPALAGNGAQK